MKLPSLPLLVLDTETTGFVPKVHHVIEYAAVRVEGGEIVGSYDQLFFADEIPSVVEVLTRIRTADIAQMPKFEDRREEIKGGIPENAIIVGQNVGFDIGMLKGEGIDLSERPWIDTSMLASLVFPELESYSLGYLSEVLKLNHAPKHRALGDVHATLELLGRCWERLLELPSPLHAQAMAIMERAPEGYRRFFQALPKPTAKRKPQWLAMKPETPLPAAAGENALNLQTPPPGQVQLIGESLDPGTLVAIMERSDADRSQTHWIAVKNLDAVVRRLPEKFRDGEKVRILYPPSHLLDPQAAKRLEGAETYTADEATLALKLAWYEPVTRNDLPLHGGEEAVWRGTLACTDTSAAYLKQFDDLPSVALVDHRQLLRFVDTSDHPANLALKEKAHVIIDDASMLEDTATKAYGWYCAIEDLRAASERDDALTHLTDLVQLWIEKVRTGQDMRYLAAPDLTSPEGKGLRSQLADIRKTGFPAQIAVQLECLEKILEPENLAHRLAWIEIRQNGAQTIQSVPESVSILLRDLLYTRTPTTLLIPPGSSERLGEVLPDTPAATVQKRDVEPLTLPITFPILTLDAILSSPPPGKSIIVIGGRGTIEAQYVKFTEELEQKGVTIICQGIGGGQGRMRAEFLAAKAPVLWLVTPWIFEGLELPPGTVDHFFVTSLPFDYYSHPVLSRRAQRYRSGFADYFFPRLLQRLFRLLRTYARFRTATGDVAVIDERIRTKGYGKDVIAYLNRFSTEGKGIERLAVSGERLATAEEPPQAKDAATPTKPKTRRKKSTKKKNDEGQLAMF